MKLRVITGYLSSLAAAAERAWRGGRVQVVAIQCRACGRWTHPNGWDPYHSTCDSCADYARKRAEVSSSCRG